MPQGGEVKKRCRVCIKRLLFPLIESRYFVGNRRGFCLLSERTTNKGKAVFCWNNVTIMVIICEFVL